MREGVENLPAETDRFGLRYHGPVVEGVVTLPSGHTAGSIQAYVSTIAVSGKPGPYGQVHFDNAADVYLKNYAVLSLDEVLYNTSIMGKTLGKEAVPFVAPSGRVWILSATGNWRCDDASFAGTAKRFGVFGKNVANNAHTVTITNPALGNTDLSACTLRLTDATRDGSKRIYRAEAGGIAIAWLELTLSEPTPTTIGASFAIVRDVATTRGAFTSQPTTYSAPDDQWDVSIGVYNTKTIDTPTRIVWEFTPAPPNYIQTPTAGTITLLTFYRITGHVFSMTYADNGALIDGTMDVQTKRSGSSTIAINVTSSGTCTVDQTYDGSTWSETVSGTVEVEVGATLSSNITAESRVTLNRGGSSVGSIVYSVDGVMTDVRSEKEVGGAGPMYVSTPGNGLSPLLHVVNTTSQATTEGYEFKADGATVKTYPRPPINFNQSDTKSNIPLASNAIGHIFPAANTYPSADGAPPPDNALFAQIGVSTIVLTGDGYKYPYLFSRIMRRSNSVLSVPGAMITSATSGGGGTVTMESAWDSHLLGRNGILDPTRPTVAASYGGGEVTWDLPTVSEQPVTGEWVRGATATQNVGFV
ncbi:hypothetical protein [Denitromonas halophila]|uniref:Uncharacterized protein n=1 Tax=Denitromonas halophila TaxID=1629404 RepID=A0A557QLU9_9RHOO|nr:hypothetical protein [Denitromonas halophila]TVO53864.1 hypothetical protein FHP91_13790 [Denitromonas halophila]